MRWRLLSHAHNTYLNAASKSLHSLDMFDLRAIVMVILSVGCGDQDGFWRNTHLQQRDGGWPVCMCVCMCVYIFVPIPLAHKCMCVRTIT